MGLEISIPRKERPDVRTVGCPVEYSVTKPQMPAAPPDLGEHTDEILCQAGFDAAAIAGLRANGIL